MLAMSATSPIESNGSQVSLDSRGSSSHDEDSLDMAAPVDDRERLSLLDAAVKWIREELTALHKCDQSILKQLQSVHSSVRDLKEQHKSAVAANRQLEKRFLYSDMSVDEEEKEDNTDDELSNFEFSVEPPQSPMDLKVSLDRFLNPAKTKSTPTPPLTTRHDDASSRSSSQQSTGRGGEERRGSGAKVLMDIGTDPRGRATIVGATSPPPRIQSPLNSQEKQMAELKAEAKKDGRSSVLFEMQMLRQKLQVTAKEELAQLHSKFDIEPPTAAPQKLEIPQGKKSAFNRYSIFERMDQLLEPSGSPGHTRQSSEPVNLASLNYGEMNGSPQFGSSMSVNVHRSSSDQYRNSPGPHRPQNSHTTHELHHGGSSSSVNSSGRRESSGSNSPDDRPPSTHYNTSVIRRKKKSKEEGTLEKKRNPLKYSVESLNETDYSNRGRDDVYDHLATSQYDEPQYQNVPHGGGGGRMVESGSLPRYYSRKQQPRGHNPLMHSRSEMNFPPPADIYPEAPTRAGDSIQPYMTVSQLRAEMEAFEKPKKQFVYTPYVENKDRKSSCPVNQSPGSSHYSHSSSHHQKRTSYLPAERTWL